MIRDYYGMPMSCRERLPKIRKFKIEPLESTILHEFSEIFMLSMNSDSDYYRQKTHIECFIIVEIDYRNSGNSKYHKEKSQTLI
jgi:hypothetical protein